MLQPYKRKLINSQFITTFKIKFDDHDSLTMELMDELFQEKLEVLALLEEELEEEELNRMDEEGDGVEEIAVRPGRQNFFLLSNAHFKRQFRLSKRYVRRINVLTLYNIHYIHIILSKKTEGG